MKKHYYDEQFKNKLGQSKKVFFFLVFILATSLALGYFHLIKDHDYLIFFYLFLIIPGLAILIKTLYFYFLNFLYGDSYLILDPEPGAIGGQVGGTIYLTNNAKPDGLSLKIVCLNDYYISSNSFKRKEEVLFSHSGEPTVIKKSDSLNDNTKILIPFIFNIPINLPASKKAPAKELHSGSEGDIIWRIKIFQKNFFFDLNCTFEIPVEISTENSSLNVKEMNNIDREREREQQLENLSQIELGIYDLKSITPKMERSKSTSELSYTFPIFRFKQLSLFLLALFSVIILVQLFNSFTFMGFVICLLFFTAFVASTFHKLQILITDKDIKSSRTVHSFWSREKIARTSELVSIETKLVFKSGRGIKAKEYYNLIGNFSEGVSFNLAEFIPEQKNAQSLKNEILHFIKKKGE
jgi:hypothetical protein